MWRSCVILSIACATYLVPAQEGTESSSLLQRYTPGAQRERVYERVVGEFRLTGSAERATVLQLSAHLEEDFAEAAAQLATSRSALREILGSHRSCGHRRAQFYAAEQREEGLRERWSHLLTMRCLAFHLARNQSGDLRECGGLPLPPDDLQPLTSLLEADCAKSLAVAETSSELGGEVRTVRAAPPRRVSLFAQWSRRATSGSTAKGWGLISVLAIVFTLLSMVVLLAQSRSRPPTARRAGVPAPPSPRPASPTATLLAADASPAPSPSKAPQGWPRSPGPIVRAPVQERSAQGPTALSTPLRASPPSTERIVVAARTPSLGISEHSDVSDRLFETQITRLCPELVVPSYKECCLVLPSWPLPATAGDLRGEVRDKLGKQLLTLSLTTSTLRGVGSASTRSMGQSEPRPSARPPEFITVSGQNKRSLAFCKVDFLGGLGPLARVFTSDGHPYASLTREAGEDVGPSRAYRLEPSSAAAGWLLHFSGDFQGHAAKVTNEAGRTLALVSSEDLDQTRYRLRLGPHAETCLIILALMAIERLLVDRV